MSQFIECGISTESPLPDDIRDFVKKFRNGLLDSRISLVASSTFDGDWVALLFWQSMYKILLWISLVYLSKSGYMLKGPLYVVFL